MDTVLWNDARIALVTASYGQYSAHGVATGTTCATRAVSHQISAKCNKGALFPYDDSCHVNYSAHKVSVHALSKFLSTCSNFNCCST